MHTFGSHCSTHTTQLSWHLQSEWGEEELCPALSRAVERGKTHLQFTDDLRQ